jgi:predicted ATPase/DNA-binding CsgD family transcriptional regulator
MVAYSPISSFVGRLSEMTTLRQMFDSGVRLITLTGPGGMGKTRLALETTAQICNDFSDGVHFVPLDALTESGQVLPKIANALEVAESGDTPILNDLCKALADKHILLCVDNWEHVLEAASQMAELLAACPRLHVLATSRAALHLRGEQEFPLKPLAISSSNEPAQSFAFQLFVDRARAVKPGFQPDEKDTQTIAAICSMLDGLPLAIELAAALLRLFSAQALLTRLQNSPGLQGRSGSMRMLVGGARDLPDRQQTLWSTIEWSYSLLDAAEKRVFRWLAIFAGGCDLDAAQEVCGREEATSRPFLDTLIALVEKNLLWTAQMEGEPRFMMLRTIQDFALEQLGTTGELHQARQRHAAHYLQLALSAEQEFFGPERGAWLQRLDQENDNLRAVLGWSLEQAAPETAYQLGGALWRFWVARGYQTEGRQWISKILYQQGNVSTKVKANLLNGAGGLAFFCGDYETAKRYFTECLDLRTQINDRAGISAIHHNLGHMAMEINDSETSLFHMHASLQLDRELGYEPGIASGLLSIGLIFVKQADLRSAEENVREGLAISQKIGDQWHMATANQLLGDITYAQGKFEQAHAYTKESEKIFTEIGDLLHLNSCNYAFGLIELQQGNFQQAESHFFAYLKQRYENDHKIGIANGLELLAYLASARSDMQKAARLWGAADAIRNSIGAPLTEFDKIDSERYITAARKKLREIVFQTEIETGAAMRLEQAVQYALTPEKQGDQIKSMKTRTKSLPAGLTTREVEVLRLVAQGLSDAEVADHLVLSTRTINAHLTSIYNKLGVNSRMAAARFAYKQNLVQPSTGDVFA